VDRRKSFSASAIRVDKDAASSGGIFICWNGTVAPGPIWSVEAGRFASMICSGSPSDHEGVHGAYL